MSIIKTVDVKGLEHHERENLIFPNLEQLNAGDSLRIVVDFNPVPLVYLLNAQDELKVEYEKEGPEEWVLHVEKTVQRQERKEHLKELLRNLQEGGTSEEAKAKAKRLFQAVDAHTLGIIEQELIREGVSHEEIRSKLCDIHLETMKDSLVSKRIEVGAPHPVHTLMEEHKVILDNLGELRLLLEKLPAKNSLQELAGDLGKLQDIAHHLVEAESHHQREEEVLFPKLEAHDVIEPPAIMKLDHIEFRQRKQELYRVSHNSEDFDFDTFKSRILESGSYLVKELDGHIFKEDNILYQIALQVLSTEEWEDVKKGCDKIGYCCFTPGDQKEQEEVVELDLRPLPPYQRHEKIFAIWNNLQPGQALRIINDHDPKPLRYQFEAEYKNRHQWAYEKSGPQSWAVKIKRV